MPKPRKIPFPRKDIREALNAIAQHPTGMPRKVIRAPKLTAQEAAALAARTTKKQPLFIKREARKLTAQQLDNIARQISRERGISVSLAKEALWKELSTQPPAKGVRQPVVLSKAIPTREDLELKGYRAVKYKGQVVYLSPGQLKQIAKDAGIKIETTTTIKGQATPSKGIYERTTGISPEARAAADRRAMADAERLRTEAIREWTIQQRDFKIDSTKTRNPAESTDIKRSPLSAKAETYAEALFKKAYKQLSTAEKKTIKIIIETEARLASKATSSVVGRNIPRGGGGIGGVGLGQGIEQIK